MIEIEDFSAFGSGIIDWSENNEPMPTSGALFFEKTYSEPINFVGHYYPESFWIEPYSVDGVERTITFNAPEISIYNDVNNSGLLYFNGDINVNATSFLLRTASQYKGSVSFNGNVVLNTTFMTKSPPAYNPPLISSIYFSNGSSNFDSCSWYNIYQNVEFGQNSSINITSNTNGKTIIKASTLTGTVTLDVESGVQDGDTFLIEATDNQLVITDGEWTATPSTSGNVTTYTLAKAGPSMKQRLFYTYENGQRVFRFLRSGL